MIVIVIVVIVMTQVKFEEGWWPAFIKENASPKFVVQSDAFPGFERRSFVTAEIRPRWRWQESAPNWLNLTNGTTSEAPTGEEAVALEEAAAPEE